MDILGPWSLRENVSPLWSLLVCSQKYSSHMDVTSVSKYVHLFVCLFVSLNVLGTPVKEAEIGLMITNFQEEKIAY